ncbi:UNVERIFIED_CONTAM: hypothetical protein Cloal_4352 [Acetivibrio alkalicellulosi]
MIMGKYTIKNGQEIIVRRAKKEDIPGILKLYECVKITPDNLEIKLNKEDENSFVNRGGFFEILTNKDLEKIIYDDRYIVLVSVLIKNKDEEINSCLYCKLDVESNWKQKSFDILDIKQKKFEKALIENKVCTAVEHAIIPSVQSRGVAYPVIFEMYRYLINCEKLFVMLQIYTLKGVFFRGKYNSIYLPNKRSIILNEKLGAYFVASYDIPKKRVGENEIEIKSDLYILDLEYAIGILRKKLNIL